MSSIVDLLGSLPEFVIEDGIPRQRSLYSTGQSQTQGTFSFKWKKRHTYESRIVQDSFREWIRKRYQMEGVDLSDLIKGKRLLDAGCGSGFGAMLLFGEALRKCSYIGVDISDAVDVAKKRFAESDLPGQFIQASIMDLPVQVGNFDLIFSEGVLHHTDSTEQAIRYLSSRLKGQGIMMFYVYNKKSAIREFTDDYVRAQLENMTDEEAWQALMPLTRLGEALGKMKVELEIEEEVPILGIPAGKIDIQRFLYWYFIKAYYRPDWSLEEMNHINFDWFRPKNCHRQTPEQVANWVEQCGMRILKLDVEQAGITVVALKQ